MHFTNAFLLFAVVFCVTALCIGFTDRVTADDNPAALSVPVDDVGTINGRMVLPSEIPTWFRGGQMSFDKAVVMIEGMYRGPRLNRPDNYSEMSREERQAWFAEFRKTEAYEKYEKEKREAYENRPVWTFPVAEDGSFEVKGMKLGRYNVIPLFPHAAARGKELTSQSWGSAFKQIVLSDERTSIDVGNMELKLKNVVMPGDMAPTWRATGYDGKEIKSSDFHGQYVILDFWATWCGPCIAEIPNLAKVYEEFRGDRLEVIGLSIDDTIDLPTGFLQKRPSIYRQAYLGQWHDTETTTRDFGIQSVPSIWLIGPSGRVIDRDLAGARLGEAVREALRKTADTNEAESSGAAGIGTK
ncbi:MAG: TlpA family protein disulfide reductase [Pirellulaceae bacterium]|nr:TlpA family protein disulfide reductase [Pirellulaceae bacterium]